MLAAQKNLQALQIILKAILEKEGDIRILAILYLDQWYSRYSTRAWLLKASCETYDALLALWKGAKVILERPRYDYEIAPLLNSLKKNTENKV